MNSVNLVGRLSNNPQLRITTNGKQICRFSIAVTRRFKNATGVYEADFINCVAFNKTAELINEYIQKGDLVGVSGRIQTGSYTAQDGSKRYTTDVVADNIQFLDTRRQAEARANNTTPYDYNDAPASAPMNDVDIADDPFADFGDNVSIDDNFLE